MEVQGNSLPFTPVLKFEAKHSMCNHLFRGNMVPVTFMLLASFFWKDIGNVIGEGADRLTFLNLESQGNSLASGTALLHEVCKSFLFKNPSNSSSTVFEELAYCVPLFAWQSNKATFFLFQNKETTTKNPTLLTRNTSVYFGEKSTHTHLLHTVSILLK